MDNNFDSPRPSGELERLQGLGFERVGSSDFAIGGRLLIENPVDSQRIYVPFGGVDSERIESIRLTNTSMGKETQSLCVQVMKQQSPEITARFGNKKLFSEFTPNGSGSMSREYNASEITQLELLSEKSINEQMENSGFTREFDNNNVTIMRYKKPNGELLAVVSAGKLKGLFIPIEDIGDSRGILDSQKLKVVKIEEFPGYLPDDPPGTGVRVSNGWAEFTIDPEYPTYPKQPRIIREPSEEEIGLAPIPEILEQSGFKRGGVNDTETIRKINEIYGIPIDKLTTDMQGSGFLGRGENLVDVLAQDNDTVRALGLTHQEVAKPLRYIQKLYRLRMLAATGGRMSEPEINEITIAGHPYKIDIEQWRGVKQSPFHDGTSGSNDFTVTNLESDESFSASSLLTEMITRYGFYEGHGTSYRTPPEQIINTFSHLRSSKSHRS